MLADRVREFAVLDVAVELLAHIPAMLPGTIKIVGSAPSTGGVVRLVLDVTHTGAKGGQWTATVEDDGRSRWITFGPNG